MKPANHGTGIASLSVALLLAAFIPLRAQQAQDPGPVPQTVEEALHQMSDLAGVIFIGEVLAVRHPPVEQAASGIVEVDFRVDQAVRGCPPGGTYTLREWAGLWQAGDDRYLPGQRLLMMLHSPNAAGISSPVGGMDGALPLRPASTSLATASASVSPDAATPASAPPTPASLNPASLNVDLRWIGARILRKVSYASTAPATASARSVAPATEAPPAAAPQQAPVSTIAGMLGGWQQQALP